MKDSLHSIDLFRCESVTLRTYWVLVVMDQYTRRIVGFGVHAGIVDGVALCRMFNRAIRGQATPKYLSSDHDPLYRFHQWQANLRVLGVTEIKTVPYVPISHPFVERLIGTIRREYLDHSLFWNAVDLESKLVASPQDQPAIVGGESCRLGETDCKMFMTYNTNGSLASAVVVPVGVDPNTCTPNYDCCNATDPFPLSIENVNQIL